MFSRRAGHNGHGAHRRCPLPSTAPACICCLRGCDRRISAISPPRTPEPRDAFAKRSAVGVASIKPAAQLLRWRQAAIPIEVLQGDGAVGGLVPTVRVVVIRGHGWSQRSMRCRRSLRRWVGHWWDRGIAGGVELNAARRLIVSGRVALPQVAVGEADGLRPTAPEPKQEHRLRP